MTNQYILDEVEYSLPPLSAELREKILDAVWTVLCDYREDDKEDE